MIRCLILLDTEVYEIKIFHKELNHLGINMLQHEIISRGLYINKITDLIKNLLKHYDIYIIHKLNKYIKPKNVQILSNHPLERVQVDLTYFNKKIELYELKEKYLLNFVDHFSKFTKSYLIENKSAELVLEKIKDFIKTVGKPSTSILILEENLQQTSLNYSVTLKK